MISLHASAAAFFLLGGASRVIAHGIVNGIIVDGKYWEGYQPSFKYNPNPPKVIGWSTSGNDDHGPVEPDKYTSPAIACHLGAKPAALSAPCQAGSSISLQWTVWNPTHKGPVITYLANCNGPCDAVDPLSLEFFKIDEMGLLGQADARYQQGHWASDTLIEANSTWTVQLPKDIAAGNYVLRHEIIAMHSAHLKNGAQNYPQCVNLEIAGGGSAKPTGTPATQLYTPQSVDYSIWRDPLPAFQIPGPAIYTGGAGGAQSAAAAAGGMNAGLKSKAATPGGEEAPAKAAPSGFATVVSTSSSSSTAGETAATEAAGGGLADQEGDDGYDTCEL